MAIEQGLYQFIVANLPSSLGVGQSVFWSNAPKNATYPVVVLASAHTYHSMTAAGDASLVGRRIEIACISAVDLPSARALLRAVKSMLNGYSGTLPDGTVVQGIFFNTDFDLMYEVGAKSYAHGALLDVTIWCIESGS